MIYFLILNLANLVALSLMHVPFWRRVRLKKDALLVRMRKPVKFNMSGMLCSWSL